MSVDQFAFNLYCGMHENCINDVAGPAFDGLIVSDCTDSARQDLQAVSRRVPAGLQFAESCSSGRLPKDNNNRAALTAAAGYLLSLFH